MDRAELTRRLSGGVTPAMATPLSQDGYAVNGSSVPVLVDFLLTAGVSGLFVGGTTGEGILLPVGERRFLHEAVVEAAASRAPVLIHVGANDTATAIALAEHAQMIGADAIVAVTPYFYGVNEDALAAYFATIAKAAPETPLFLYDIPHMAVNGVSASLFSRLIEDIPSLAGIKSSHHDAQQIRRLVDVAPNGVIVLAGNERIALGSLALGAAGLISGLSTAVPEPFVALTTAFAAGELDESRRQQRRINLMLDRIPAGTRIGTIKKLLIDRGIPAGPPMPPRPTDGADRWPELLAIMAG